MNFSQKLKYQIIFMDNLLIHKKEFTIFIAHKRVLISQCLLLQG